MASGDMANLVPHHGRDVIIGLHDVENALVEPDLAIGQNPGVDGVAVENDELPIELALPGRPHDPVPDPLQPALIGRVAQHTLALQAVLPGLFGELGQLAVGNQHELASPQGCIIRATGNERQDRSCRQAHDQFPAPDQISWWFCGHRNSPLVC